MCSRTALPIINIGLSQSIKGKFDKFTFVLLQLILSISVFKTNKFEF
jgi:hypothetical protein